MRIEQKVFVVTRPVAEAHGQFDLGIPVVGEAVAVGINVGRELCILIDAAAKIIFLSMGDDECDVHHQKKKKNDKISIFILDVYKEGSIIMIVNLVIVRLDRRTISIAEHDLNHFSFNR